MHHSKTLLTDVATTESKVSALGPKLVKALILSSLISQRNGIHLKFSFHSSESLLLPQVICTHGLISTTLWRVTVKRHQQQTAGNFCDSLFVYRTHTVFMCTRSNQGQRRRLCTECKHNVSSEHHIPAEYQISLTGVCVEKDIWSLQTVTAQTCIKEKTH